MKVEFTGRSFDVTDSIREHTDNKLGRVLRGLDSVKDVQVTLTLEKFRHIAEIIVHMKSKTFAVKEETDDMYTAVGFAVDKLERAIRKHKDKIVGSRRKARNPFDVAAVSQVDFPEEDEELTADTPKILRSDDFTLKPMSVEEAALQLSSARENFIVFRNSSSEIINVLYVLDDGNYGLIEPRE